MIRCLDIKPSYSIENILSKLAGSSSGSFNENWFLGLKNQERTLDIQLERLRLDEINNQFSIKIYEGELRKNLLFQIGFLEEKAAKLRISKASLKVVAKITQDSETEEISISRLRSMRDLLSVAVNKATEEPKKVSPELRPRFEEILKELLADYKNDNFYCQQPAKKAELLDRTIENERLIAKFSGILGQNPPKGMSMYNTEQQIEFYKQKLAPLKRIQAELEAKQERLKSNLENDEFKPQVETKKSAILRSSLVSLKPSTDCVFPKEPTKIETALSSVNEKIMTIKVEISMVDVELRKQEAKLKILQTEDGTPKPNYKLNNL